MNDFEQAVTKPVLEQKGAGAGSDKCPLDPGFLVGGDANDGGTREERKNLTRRLNAVDSWHIHVHQYHVGTNLLNKLNRFKTIRRFPDDLHSRVMVKEGPQRPSHARMIIDYNHG